MKKRFFEREKKAYPLVPTDKRTKSATLTMCIGCGVNLALFFVKMFIGLASNSLPVLGDAINNLADTITCIIAVASFLIVRKKSSGAVPYGYGRMEYIADFMMSVVVCIVGGALVYLAVERLTLPYLMTFNWLYFGIIAATAVVKILLGLFYRWRNKGVDSGVLKGAMLDSFTDAGITVTTLIGFSLARYASLRLDGIFGLIVAVVIIVNGAKLLVSSTRTLLGRPLDADSAEKITSLLLEKEAVSEVKSLHLHEYGSAYKELVIEVVLTEEMKYDIIKKTIAEATEEIGSRFGVVAKICIAR